jgi:hypothetical protein
MTSTKKHADPTNGGTIDAAVILSSIQKSGLIFRGTLVFRRAPNSLFDQRPGELSSIQTKDARCLSSKPTPALAFAMSASIDLATAFAHLTNFTIENWILQPPSMIGEVGLQFEWALRLLRVMPSLQRLSICLFGTNFLSMWANAGWFFPGCERCKW